MTSEMKTTSIVLKLMDDSPDQPKWHVNLSLSKRNADALRRMAKLKGMGQSEIVDGLLTQYFEAMVKIKDGGGNP